MTNTWGFDGGIDITGDFDSLKAAFNFGASYSYSVTVSTQLTLKLSRPTDMLRHRGYWTFLPYYIQSGKPIAILPGADQYLNRSCGTMSSTPLDNFMRRRDVALYDPVFSCKTTEYTTNNSTCNKTPFVDSNGKAGGVSVFVAADCKTNLRLPLEDQDARYQQHGVAGPT